MDFVFVEGLRLRGKHGVHEHERQNEQDFLIDIRAQFDTRAAAKSDNIADTLNYEHFCEIARNVVGHNSYFLIERLGETIAARILEDNRIAQIEITIRKPAALESGVPGITVIRDR